MFQKFLGLFLGGVGLLIFGFLVQDGRIGELKQETPYWREIGAGLMAMGGVFLLLFFADTCAPKSRFTHFLKGVLGGSAFMVLGGGIAWSIFDPAIDAWRLSQDGVRRTASVVSVDYTPKIGKYGRSQTTAKVRLDGELRTLPRFRGPRDQREVEVLVLPDDTSVLRLAAEGDEFLDLVEDSPGTWMLGLIGPASVLMVLYGAFAFLSGFSGRNRKEFLEPG